MAHIFNEDLCKGVSFSYINSKKFKTAEISLSFFIPLDKRFASAFSLLISVLSDSCNKFKSFKDLNKQTEDLYGACIDYNISKKGNYHILDLFVCSLDDKFTMNHENNINKMSEILCDLVFDPLVKNNSFDESVVSRKKLEISELIDSRITDKRVWSMFQCKKTMFKNEQSGIDTLGEKSDINSISPSYLYEIYQKMLRESRIKIMMSASSEYNTVLELFKSKFSKINRNYFEFEKCNFICPSEIKYVNEKLDVQQCKLVMGFRSPFIKPDDTHVMSLASAIFGGLPTSRLFMSVREKMNLCYYCSSRFDSFNGSLFVESGVEQSNAEKAKNEILNQLKIMGESLVSDDEINDAKNYLSQYATSISDTIDGLHNWYLSQYSCGLSESPEEFAGKISEISKENIKNCMSNVFLDTVYMLKGDE